MVGGKSGIDGNNGNVFSVTYEISTMGKASIPTSRPPPSRPHRSDFALLYHSRPPPPFFGALFERSGVNLILSLILKKSNAKLETRLAPTKAKTAIVNATNRPALFWGKSISQINRKIIAQMKGIAVAVDVPSDSFNSRFSRSFSSRNRRRSIARSRY